MVGALTVTFNEAQLTEVIKEYLENEGMKLVGKPVFSYDNGGGSPTDRGNGVSCQATYTQITKSLPGD